MLSSSLQDVGGIEGATTSFPILFIVLVLTAYILYRRYRSRRQLIERIIELEELSLAGRAIVASQLDVINLSGLIAEQTSNIIDTSTLQIGLFAGSVYKILYWTLDGEIRDTPQVFDLSERSGLVGWVRTSKKSLLVRDFHKETDTLPAQPIYINDYPPRSAIFVPLISGTEVIGVIAAHSQQPNAFSQRDLGRLTILANQGAAAIENALIYEKERKRAAQLELVGQIARQVNAISDLDELFTEIVLLTQSTFNFASVNIFGVDPLTKDAILQASTIPDLLPGSLRIKQGHGLVGNAMASRQTALSDNVFEDARLLTNQWSTLTRSEIAIPLIVDEELLGVMDFQSEQLGTFTAQEKTVLEALAAQVAIAIHKAHQFALQRKQSWITTAQLQTAEVISQNADLDSLLAAIVRLTPLLVGVESCAILLWDDPLYAYRGTAEFGLDGLANERFWAGEDGAATYSIGIWPALDAVHVGHERLYTDRPPPWSDRSSAGPCLLLPMLAKGRLVAVMVVEGPGSQDSFSENGREELLLNITNQTALAIDSILLHEAQQEEAWVNTALLQVAEAVNRLTDLNEILSTIVRMVPLLVGVHSCIILIWDEASQAFITGPSHGLSEMGQGLLESFEVDLKEFPLLKKQDIERIGPEANYYIFRLPEWMATVVDSTTAGLVPLYARARLVGAMVIGPTTNDRPLAGRRLNIISGIAQQAAIAVVNDQLYKESAERSRMEQELNVARSIQASLIPEAQPDIPGCTVAGYWEAARQVSGDFYDFMELSDGEWGIAVADVADKGIPAALFMALSRTILRTVAFNRRKPAQVLERTNQLIYNDSTSDLFVTVFYAVWNPNTATLTFSSGGHNPPILLRNDGSVSLLEVDGIALGVLESINLAQKSIRLGPDDIIIFYTDGVTEAMNEDYDEFGLERLCLVANNARHGTPKAMIGAIRQAINDHVGGTPQFDDITLVILKR